MNRVDISPRVIGAVLVALVGVALVASIGTTAVQATNAQDTGVVVDDAATLDSGEFAQQQGTADCTRCHSGTKGSGLNPEMCAECHTETYQAWNESGHADSLSEGQSAVRIMRDERCQECHVEAEIKNREDIDFQTKQHEVKGVDEPITCEACHAPPEVGWFGHFGKGGDSLEPVGTGPHGAGDATVTSAETVCSSCHSNDVVLQLANEGKISPHSTALTGEVDGNDSNQTATPSPTETTETETETPGFGALVALAGILGAALVLFRRR